MDKLQALLLKKYQAKTLASLYRASFDPKCVQIEEWVNEFVSHLTPLNDHPDILKVKKGEKESEYKVDSDGIRQLIQFLNFRPLLFEKKFIFLFDAQDLSVIVSNKLLKTFEELESSVCLILLIPDNAEMLSTVESRAIKLQVPKSESRQVLDFDFKQFKSPIDLLNHLKKDTLGTMDEKLFIEHYIDNWLRDLPLNEEGQKKCVEMLAALKMNEEASNFNNAKLSRLASFFP